MATRALRFPGRSPISKLSYPLFGLGCIYVAPISRCASRRNRLASASSTSIIRRSYSAQKGWIPLSMPSKSTLAANIEKSIRNISEPVVQRAYVALGSNLGDRIDWIERACNMMSARGIKITRTSSLWETEPMYVLNQESFINGVCEVETTLGPIALLDELQGIENCLGRKKLIDKGPRNIDLDILLYGDEVVDHERLKVPHALMLEREFVLRPLAELIPDKPLDPNSPWKLTQDYLNVLPVSLPPLSTVAPIRPYLEYLRPLKADRKTEIMAILNITPDSFSNKLEESDHSDIIKTVLGAIDIDAGLPILDIGGQSTAPGAKPVNPEEEFNRISPILSILNNTSQLDQISGPKYNRNSFAISVDTFYSSVAEAAIAIGVDIINDVSAGQLDPEMLPTVAKLGKTICLMHMRGTPQTMNTLTSYPDGLIPTIARELLERVAAAEAAGIRRWRIILDPGIGFAKTHEQNLEILRNLDELRQWPGLKGLPWLLGVSRKRFIGHVTGVSDPRERIMGTAAAVAACVQGGADIVRVHDVSEMAQVVRMADAVWRGWESVGGFSKVEPLLETSEGLLPIR